MSGRNGGHLAPSAFGSFASKQRTFGTKHALAQIALENHNTEAIVRILAEKKLAEEVDLVNGGRLELYFTREEQEEARKDYEAAKAAGVPLSDVEFLSKEAMAEVSDSFS